MGPLLSSVIAQHEGRLKRIKAEKVRRFAAKKAAVRRPPELTLKTTSPAVLHELA